MFFKCHLRKIEKKDIGRLIANTKIRLSSYNNWYINRKELCRSMNLLCWDKSIKWPEIT